MQWKRSTSPNRLICPLSDSANHRNTKVPSSYWYINKSAIKFGVGLRMNSFTRFNQRSLFSCILWICNGFSIWLEVLRPPDLPRCCVPRALKITLSQSLCSRRGSSLVKGLLKPTVAINLPSHWHVLTPRIQQANLSQIMAALTEELRTP